MKFDYHFHVYILPFFDYVLLYYHIFPWKLLPLILFLSLGSKQHTLQFFNKALGWLAFIFAVAILAVLVKYNCAKEAFKVAVLVYQILLFTLQLSLLIGHCIVVRVVFVAHCYLYLLKYAEHIFSINQLILYMFKNCQNQFVEEFPFIFQKLGKKHRCHIRLIFRQYR